MKKAIVTILILLIIAFSYYKIKEKEISKNSDSVTTFIGENHSDVGSRYMIENLNNAQKEAKNKVNDRLSRIKDKKMGSDKKTFEPMFKIEEKPNFDINLIKKVEFFDYKEKSFFVSDNFKVESVDEEINKILETPLKNYETDEVIKIKNYFIFDYITPTDLNSTMKGMYFKEDIRSFEFYVIDHTEESKYKKVRFTNCTSDSTCRNDTGLISIVYGLSDGLGLGVIYNNHEKNRFRINKKGEVLIYDENDETGKFIPEIQFYKQEG